MFAQGIAERRAPLHGVLDVLEDGSKGRLGLLLGQDVQTLNERQAGVDHRCEQAREGDQILGVDARAETDLERKRLLLDLDRVQVLLAQARVDGLYILGNHRART
jgi:hypothetical protein